jgi:hypothetical protein
MQLRIAIKVPGLRVLRYTGGDVRCNILIVSLP